MSSRGVLMALVVVVVVGCGGKSFKMPGTGGADGAAGVTGAGGTGMAGEAGELDAAIDVAEAGTDGPFCGALRLDRIAPDLLLLLDRSGSMNTTPDGKNCVADAGAACMTRWAGVTQAVDQVVQETETSVRWGLKFFAEGTLASTCTVSDAIAVPVGPGSAAAIRASIAATLPAGRTPTRAAVGSAAAYLTGLTDPNPKVLLLATDGVPNCSPGGNPLDSDLAGTVEAVKVVAESGVPVYVIGIGNLPTEIGMLEDLAIAGGRPHAGTPAYYPAATTAELVDALHAIGAQSMPCSYALPATPGNPKAVVVKTGAAVVPYDESHADGWAYETGMKSIHLYGTWCTKSQSGQLANLTETGVCVGGI